MGFSMNHLHDLDHLVNTYYVLRHGKSLANDEGLIISSPADGVPRYGLSEEGRRQVVDALTEALENHVLDRTTLIVSSDFARARETAEIAATLLGTQDVILASRLRERFFGAWDKQHTSNYQHVWEADSVDGGQKQNNVESAHEVASRTTSLIMDLERDYHGRNILLVSHGDALQILQTAFERVDASQHRLLPHLETGQIRKLELQAVERNV